MALRDSKGIALMMVLWVIAILSLAALEFCFAMRTEVNITRNYEDAVRLHAAAEGALQRAIAELLLKHDARLQQIRRNTRQGEAPVDIQELVTDGREYPVSFERIQCVFQVRGEGGKVNINRVSDAVLRKIVGNMGLEGEARDVVVDSIMDWKDADDFLRVNGAESEYYRSLRDPYDAKNANLDCIEELLLVKGVTPELFYGRKERAREGEAVREVTPGMKDIFSIYAAGEQIDINSANLPVLRVVLSLPLEVCRLVMKAREEKSFENIEDLKARVPEIVPFLNEIGRFVMFGGMNPYYSVEARAKSETGYSGGGIRAVVKIDARDKEGYKIVQWLDSFQDFAK
ncbi:MAG TPA: hypothetical protein VLS90_04990 [Thermodesulfobacteriota bacterium]|nr:hypothetical protein [Thermodesulfobacteriota bacterium]